MTTLTTHASKSEHRVLNSLRKLKKPSVILNLLSVVVLIFPVIPLAIQAAFVAVQLPSSSDTEIMSTLWFLGGPVGMIGLILATYKKRNLITIILLIYGIATYSPLLFPYYAEITSNDLLHLFYTLYFSIPVIVAIVHIVLSVKSIWVGRKEKR